MDFTSSAGFLLSQLGVLSGRSWATALAERGLSPHQHAILLTLDSAGPLTLTTLADAALVDPRNMGPVLNPLDQRGLIERRDDPADRRRRLIALTRPGAALAAELASATAALEDDLLAPLDATRRAELHELLLVLWRHAKSDG